MINVCARLPEEDRFRVPPNLRDNPNDPASQAWAEPAIELSYVGRTGIDSCSTVGGGGFTGCFNQIVNQARAERRGSRRRQLDAADRGGASAARCADRRGRGAPRKRSRQAERTANRPD